MVIVMKLSVAMVLLTCLQVSAKTVFSQDRFTFKVSDVRLEKLLGIIERRSDYTFMYNYAYVKDLPRMSIRAKNATVESILKEALGPSMRYKVLANHLIVILPAGTTMEDVRASGSVRDKDGRTLVGVTVQVKGTTIGTVTDANGHFELDVPDSAVLVFS